MKTYGVLTFSLALAGIAFVGPAGSFAAQAAGKDMTKPKISMNQAEAIAVEARRGQIKSEKLVHRSDGNAQYDFVIDSVGKTYTVVVDGTSGNVVENKMKSG
jgi:uncharacterized membrane protein YkoI